MSIEASLERIAVALEAIAGRAEVRHAVDAPAPGTVVTVTGPATELVAALQPPKRRGRPPKNAPVEKSEHLPVVETPTPVPPGSLMVDFLGDSTPVQTAPKVYTKDDVRTALMAYQDKTDQPRTFALIRTHGGTNLNDLPEANYAALITEAGK